MFKFCLHKSLINNKKVFITFYFHVDLTHLILSTNYKAPFVELALLLIILINFIFFNQAIFYQFLIIF